MSYYSHLPTIKIAELADQQKQGIFTAHTWPQKFAELAYKQKLFTTHTYQQKFASLAWKQKQGVFTTHTC